MWHIKIISGIEKVLYVGCYLHISRHPEIIIVDHMTYIIQVNLCKLKTNYLVNHLPCRIFLQHRFAAADTSDSAHSFEKDFLTGKGTRCCVLNVFKTSHKLSLFLDTLILKTFSHSKEKQVLNFLSFLDVITERGKYIEWDLWHKGNAKTSERIDRK